MEYTSSPWAIINQGLQKKKKQTVLMKKEKFGKNEKTAKCSICGKPGTRLKFGKQIIIRCTECLKKANNKKEVYPAVFKKASEK